MNSTQIQNDVLLGAERQQERQRLLQERRELLEAMAACQFFTAEQAAAWAINAHREAVRELRPENGEPWCVGGCPWSSPKLFADSFEHHFQRRFWDACKRARIDDGTAVFVAAQEPELPRRSSMGESAPADGGSPC